MKRTLLAVVCLLLLTGTARAAEPRGSVRPPGCEQPQWRVVMVNRLSHRVRFEVRSPTSVVRYAVPALTRRVELLIPRDYGKRMRLRLYWRDQLLDAATYRPLACLAHIASLGK